MKPVGLILAVTLAATIAPVSVGASLAQDVVAEAEPTARPENTALPTEWQFSVRPYFFLSGLSGSVTVEPITFPLNSTFSDLIDNVKLGGFVSFTAEKGRWGGNVDFQFIDLYGEGSGNTETSLELKNIIGEADLIFRPAAAPTLRFLAGVRVYTLEQTVILLGNDIPPASATVVDPILGAFGNWRIHPRWGFELRGDIGGFGVSSEFTYQMMGLFKWSAGDTVDIPFGYRVLGYLIEQDDVRMNTRMSGMMLGVEFRF